MKEVCVHIWRYHHFPVGIKRSPMKTPSMRSQCTMSALVSLLQLCKTALAKPALLPVPRAHRHLCSTAPPTTPFFCSARGLSGTQGQGNSLKQTQFHHPGDSFGCCNACLPQKKSSTPSLPFHPQREKKFPFSRIKKPEIADHVGYMPLPTLCTSAGINTSALPSYRVSTFSIGSCFLAAALR